MEEMSSLELSPAIKNTEQNKKALKSPGKCHSESKSYFAADASPAVLPRHSVGWKNLS